MAWVTGAGLGQQSDAIILEFTRCWKYLGDLGIMARDMVTMLDRETPHTLNDENVRRAQLEKISILIGKVAKIEMEDKKLEPKKCNFYNRGFCQMGSDCDFLHNREVCKRYEEFGICEVRGCVKRHLYVCKFVKSESGCIRGDSCEFAHPKESITRVERSTDDTLINEKEELEKDRLGVGEFGWLPTSEESVDSLKTARLDATEKENAQETDIDIVEDRDTEKNKKEDEDENDFYDQLIEAINNGNVEVHEEVMDKILEGYENVNNTKEEVKGKGVKNKKVKKSGKGLRAKGRGRGR